jgi:hypothetical protein
VEWAHAIAPGARIVVVEARSASTQDLLAAVRTARAMAGVSVVSMSWGGSEYAGQTASDSVFTTPAGHTGITFVAASGDAGSAGGAEWPSSSANVVAVGGTTLRVTASGVYQGESVWAGSGGGRSRYESEPAYQRTIQASGRRTTPDVAFDADPSTGVLVYATDPTTGLGGWAQVGGTSLGAPAWAAIIAIADQGRVLAGKSTLDGASQTLSALYSLPSSDYHAVANLSGTAVSPTLGSPNGEALVDGLVGSTLTVTARATAARSSAIAARARHHGAASGPSSLEVFDLAMTQLAAARHGVDQARDAGREAR